MLAAASIAAAAPAPPAHAEPVAFGAFTPGAPEDRGSMDRFESKIGRRPAIWLTYRNWGETPVPHISLKNAEDKGGVAMITWEAWDRNVRAMARGDYDDYLRRSAREAAAWKRPILMRPLHEANGDWYPWGLGVNGNSAEDHRAAWRHIVEVFRSEGADNVLWVWSPNVGQFDSLFPGDKWIDWVALDGYNWGALHNNWQTFDEIFAGSYRAIARLSRRPVMIAETAANERGGNKAAWIRNAFARETLERYPRLRAFVWFDVDKETDWRVDSSSATYDAFRAAMRSSLLDLDAAGLLRLSGSAAPAEPEPPAEPGAPAPPVEPAGAGPRCGLHPRRSLRSTRNWDVTLPLRCDRNGAARCMGLVKLKHVGTRRTLGVAEVELWPGRRRPVRVGLPGWARSSLQPRTRLSVRVTLRTGGGCRAGAARRVTLAR